MFHSEKCYPDWRCSLGTSCSIPERSRVLVHTHRTWSLVLRSCLGDTSNIPPCLNVLFVSYTYRLLINLCTGIIFVKHFK